MASLIISTCGSVVAEDLEVAVLALVAAAGFSASVAGDVVSAAVEAALGVAAWAAIQIENANNPPASPIPHVATCRPTRPR
jgi:hypothetical protein